MSSGYSRAVRRARSARPAAARKATTSAATSISRCPTTSRSAPSASTRRKAATSTTSSARRSIGQFDNADVVEEDWNDYTVYGGRVAARWQISPEWESTLSLIGQDGESPRAAGNRTRRSATTRSPASSTSRTTTDWYQASLNVKGDLGFAELSLTGSYFDRDIKYEYDNANYDQWRTAYYGVYLGLDLYNTDYLIGPFFNDQTQERWSYEVRLTSQGESRFQWMAGAFYEDVYDWWRLRRADPGLETTTRWAYAQYLAYYYNNQGYDIQYPLDPTEVYYLDIFDRKVKQTAVFGELTFDLTEKWSVTGGARWFEYDRDASELRQTPLGLSDRQATSSGGGRAGELGHGFGHGLQVRDAVPLRRHER